MSIEAMKQWLEALENTQTLMRLSDPQYVREYNAITSLRQAIAELEKQKPVAWRLESGQAVWFERTDPEASSALPNDVTAIPLYTHPQPKREWQGLTDEEKISVCRVGPVYAPDGVVTRKPLEYRKELEGVALMAVRQAETKLKEKNNG